MDRGVELCQQACLAFGEAGACDRAARLAVWVSHQYLIAGKASLVERLAGTRRARARRAARTAPVPAGSRSSARAARSEPESLADARDALALGRSCGDHDLEVFALSVLGQAEIAAGNFDEGLAHLEEAMAAATVGHDSQPAHACARRTAT